MLCISVAIAVMRCPSVCPSVTFVDHVKTNKHIFKIFSPLCSHTILVFPYQTGWRYSNCNPPNGGVKCRWGIGRNRDSGLIAGYRRLLDVRSAKNIYRWHSRPRTTGYSLIAGRANYEVTKTVTDDHAVHSRSQTIAQSATHHRMFVCGGLQRGRILRREENRTEQNLIVHSGISEAETTTNKRLRSTFCIEAIQTRSIARPLCDSRASCYHTSAYCI